MNKQHTLEESIKSTNRIENNNRGEWTEEKIGEIFQRIKSGGTPKRGKEKYWEDGTIPFVKIEDLNNQKGKGVSKAEEYTTEKAIEEKKTRIFKEGTILLTIYGTIGETAIVREPVATNQGIIGLWDTVDTNTIYARYALDFEQDRLASKKRETTQANIGKEILQLHKIPHPPLPEQRKIATVLYNVDQAIQKTEDIIEQTKRVKKGLMQDLFTEGYHEHEDFKNHPLLGRRPEQWDVETVGDLTKKVQYGISKSLQEEGKYPIFRMNNYENGYMRDYPMKYIDLSKEKFEKYKVEKGDILFNRTNSHELVGKTGIFELEGDYVFASYLVRLRVNDKVDPYYLNFFMNSQEGQNRLMTFATKGVSQSNINASNVQKLKVPVPEKEEQKRIVDVIRNIDDMINKNKKYLRKLKSTKKGLMQDLLTGEVRTHDKNIKVLDEVMEVENSGS